MEYYIKLVDQHELDIMLIANALNVCPKIIDYYISETQGDRLKIHNTSNNIWYCVIMEKYLTISTEYILTEYDKREYIKLYHRLLEHGVYYFDITKYNMVRHPIDRSIRIIDYGHAFMGDFDTFHIRMWYIGHKKDLIQYAKDTLDLL